MKTILIPLTLIVGCCLLQGQAQPYYAVPTTSSVQKLGATKNVAVELIKSKNRFYREITTLEGAEFAVKETSPPAGSEGKTYDYLPPEFSPGDKNIAIKINSSTGFNVLLGLKYLDPVIISIAPDGAIEADRPGVRAVEFQGQTSYSGCFLGMAQNKDGSYSLGAYTKPPMASDGSMVRAAGEQMECELQLTGKDGAQYVSRLVKLGERSRILFVPAVADR